jgi:hypothetical protein
VVFSWDRKCLYKHKQKERGRESADTRQRVKSLMTSATKFAVLIGRVKKELPKGE